jgi:hypothetical protein
VAGTGGSRSRGTCTRNPQPETIIPQFVHPGLENPKLGTLGVLTLGWWLQAPEDANDGDFFLEAAMFGWNEIAEGGDAAVYNHLIDVIDDIEDDLVEGADSRVGMPAPVDPMAEGADGEGKATGKGDEGLALDATAFFRNQVMEGGLSAAGGESGGVRENGEGRERGEAGASQEAAFATAFEAKARGRIVRREDIFDEDPLLAELSRKVVSGPEEPMSPGSGLPGRKSVDATKLQEMMDRMRRDVSKTETEEVKAETRTEVEMETGNKSGASAKGGGEEGGEGGGGGGEQSAVEQEDQKQSSPLLTSPVGQISDAWMR